MTEALIIVDVQKDFVEGGSLAVEGGQKLADTLARIVIPTYLDLGLPVYFTKDWHIDPGDHFSDTPDYVDSWPRHCEAGTDGATFAADFDEDAARNATFLKGQFKASYTGVDGINEEGDYLDEVLVRDGVTAVTIVGIAFDYCVKATAIDLAKMDFNVHVVKDFTASVHPENDEATTFELTQHNVVVYDGREYVKGIYGND